jgi:CRP/FNR family transcriptional regulator, dissimilatory nitrate respiration regulator
MSLPPLDALRKAPLFAALPDDDLRNVAALAVLRRFARKAAVFREGDRADGFFLVVSGKVKVFKLSEEGKEQILHVLEAGQTFAEAVIFEGGLYPAHAETLTDAELLFLPQRPFIALLESRPKVAVRMLGSLSRWLKRMTDLVESLSLRDVETRLRLYLRDELKTRGVPARDGATITLPVSKNVLASRLGTVPETFSRALKKLQDDGLIDVRGKQIRIVSAGALFANLPR